MPEASLQFEPDTGNHRRFRGAGDDRRIIAVAGERLEAERVYLGAAEGEGGHHMQTEEMPAVRPERPPRPAAGLERRHDVQVSGKPIAVDRIEQQDVTIAPQAGMSVEEPGLRRREQRLSRRDRTGVAGMTAPRVSKSRGSQISSNHQSPNGASAAAASRPLVAV